MRILWRLGRQKIPQIAYLAERGKSKKEKERDVVFAKNGKKTF